MNLTPLKAAAIRREQTTPTSRPAPKPASTPAGLNLTSLQAGAGNAAVAAAATVTPAAVLSTSQLPLQSTLGNLATARAMEAAAPVVPKVVSVPTAPEPHGGAVTARGPSEPVSGKSAPAKPQETEPEAVPEEQKAPEAAAAEAPAPETKAKGSAGGQETPEAAPAKAEAKAPEKGAKGGEDTEKKKEKTGGKGGTADGGDAAGGAPDPLQAIAPAAGAVRQRAKGARAHSKSPDIPVRSAQKAGIDVETEQKRTAAVTTVSDIDKAGAEKLRREAFKTELRKAIEKATSPEPTTEGQADRVMKEGAKTASTTMRSQLETERDAAATPMETAAKQEVDPSTVVKPEGGDLVLEPLGKPPAPVSPASVVPEALPDERLDYSADRAPADEAMAEAGVSNETLEKGNDPEFGPTLEARSEAEAHEVTVEGKYRTSEAMVQKRTFAVAKAGLTQELAGMHGTRELNIGNVVGKQTETERKEHEERKRVTGVIEGIKNATKEAVDGILNEMDVQAIAIFEDGLRNAESAYETTFEDEKGGLGTWLTTWRGSWKKLIERSLSKARREYLRQVGLVIDQVANCVDGKLTEAKKRVALGLKEIETFVAGLEGQSAVFGSEALTTVTEEFAALEKEIDGRRDNLINKLADQYKASYERMSAKEEQLREANKSLWERVYDATVGLIKKIIAFKDMLVSMLAKAADVIGDIISDPIGFLGNLISAVMQGLENFMAKIDVYLIQGIMDWLFGALAGAGLKLPEKFDLEGIVSIVLQILGLTYDNFRARAVAIVGEPLVGALEQGAEVFKVVMSEGVPGLWRFIKDQVTELKDMVLDAIFDFIKDSVIMAGINWIIGMLNPVSAFFKACKAIYDIVMFFIKNGSKILALVNAIIDSIAAIAKGQLGAAAALVEGALAKTIPIAIAFLASLLGLGDPSGPVRETIEKARAPINKAIDWVINLAVKGVKAVGSAVGGLFGKKPEKEKDKQDETEETGDPAHDAKVTAGLEALEEREQKVSPEGRPSREQAEALLQDVRRDHPVFTAAALSEEEDHWVYELTASKHKKYSRGIHPDCRAMIKKLRRIDGIQGINDLIKTLSGNLRPAQRAGYLFQAERTLFWHKEGVLKYVELEMSFSTAGGVEVSRFDIVIEEEDLEGRENSSKTLIFIDTKSWSEATRLGQLVINAKTKRERDEARIELQRWIDRAASRLKKYRRLGLAVLIEWKGPIPDAIAELRKPASAKAYGSIDFSEIP